MDNNASGWTWLNALTGRGAEEGKPPQSDPNEQALTKAFARCFAGDDGKKVLDHLRSMTLERHLGPLSSDGALRHLEGQRHMIAHLAAMIDRGRSNT